MRWQNFAERWLLADLIPAVPITALGDGESIECRLGGLDVLLCNVYGQIYAVDAVCPHAGQRLSGGRLRGFELRCPLHRASFDVRSGAVLKGPAAEPLKTYPVVVTGGKVSVAVG